MFDLIEFLFGGVPAYAAVAGYVGSKTYQRTKGSDPDSAVGAVFVGAFWPVSLPIVGGYLLGNRPTKTEKAAIAHKNELKAIEQRMEIERARQKEALEIEKTILSAKSDPSDLERKLTTALSDLEQSEAEKRELQRSVDMYRDIRRW